MNRLASFAAICSVLSLAACTNRGTTQPGTTSGATPTTSPSGSGTVDTTGSTGSTDATGSMGTGAENAADPIKMVHALNQMEIQAGQLAKERASSQEVKSYADRLIRDHQSADRKVVEIARQRGIDFTQIDRELQSGRMSGTSGTGGASGTTPNTAGTTGGVGAGGSTDGTSGGGHHTGTMGGATGSGQVHTGGSGSGSGSDSGSGSGMHQTGMDHSTMMRSMQDMERLRTMRGKEFDSMFLQHMVKNHEHALQMLRGFEGRQMEPQFQQVVRDLTTQITAHREEARRLMASIGGERQPTRGTQSGPGSNGTTTQPQRK